MRNAAAVLLLLLLTLGLSSLCAAVDGTVINSTTGKPQPNVVVSLVQPGQGGMQTLASAKTGADGKFRIDKSAEGMHLLQALYAGVPYNKMLQPGSPVTGLQLNVFDATTDRAAAKLTQHIVFLQPGAGQLQVNEVYFISNTTNTTFNDAKAGSLQFYVAGHTAQEGSVSVSINAPGGMPVQRPAEATNKAGVYKVGYPLKPGETQFTVAYQLPGTETFSGRSLVKADTRLVAPAGFTLEGAGVTALGADPSGKAMLYSTAGQEYTVKIAGSASAAPASAAGAEGAPEEDTGAPQIAQVKPRLYAQLPVVLALAFGVLLLGFVVLYRSRRSAVRTSAAAAAKGKSRR